jgi:hypothetical protein
MATLSFSESTGSPISIGSGDQQRVGFLKEPGTLSTFAARRVAAHEFGSFDMIGWHEVRLRVARPDGFWSTSLLAPPDVGTPESSCTGLLTYGLAGSGIGDG